MGTDDTFAEHFDAEADRLVRLAFGLCGDRAAAEDAVIEASARVLRRWRRGRVDDLGPYLRRAVVNEVRSGRRRRGRRSAREERWQRTEPVSTEGPQPPAADLEALLGALGPRQRAVVVLRYLDDRSVAETARILGVSEGTVKSQAARALETLRTHPEVVDHG